MRKPCDERSLFAIHQRRESAHLQTGAVVDEAAHALHRAINELLADRVVTTRVIVRCILHAGDHLLRMKELFVRASAHFVCK